MFYQSIQFLIHSYYSTVLGFLFVTVLAKKLYKILHTLSVFFFKNAAGTPSKRNYILYKTLNNVSCNSFFKFSSDTTYM
ncbi:hypothetical protein CN493_04255 [Bacillus thuringiensis]|nr:hypothetical protein CN493_04255 [Bacillus thuringiensis]